MTSLKLLINEMDSNDLGPNRLDMGTHNSIDTNRQKKIRILVSGASGFIGRRLVRRLLVSPNTTNWSIRCMTRKAHSLSNYFQNDRDNLEFVQVDVQNYPELVKALTGVDIAAENFARAVNETGVSRVIYLGGLTYAPEQELSKHMRSRTQVGEILKKSNAAVTIFRAAVIL